MTMKAAYTVVVTENRFKDYSIEEELLAEVGAELNVRQCNSREELLQATEYAHGVLVNLQKYDADVIRNMKNCRVIARYGIGYDNVDIAEAGRKKIYVTNVPDYGAEVSVSEHAVALLLSCVRKIPFINGKLKTGAWDVQEFKPVYTVQGKTLGIIGFGKIGRAVVHKMQAFDLERILVYEPFVTDDIREASGCMFTDTLNVLIGNSDIISLHVPLNPETRNMIGQDQIDSMKDGVILINTARGGIINEQALINGLWKGKVAGAGIDTFAEEPLSADSPLREFDNVVLTNHIGFYSVETIRTLQRKAVMNVCSVLKGSEPENPVFQV